MPSRKLTFANQTDRVNNDRSSVSEDEADALPKPYLFCVEGPAGSGKTTLCHALIKNFVQSGVSPNYVPEFSPTPIGNSLAQFLSRFASKPLTLSPEAEFMHCLADKFASLTVPYSDNCSAPTIVVADRGFITQAILGIPAITDHCNSAFARRVLSLTSDWLQSKFFVTTLVLNLPIEENISRLAQRLQRPISNSELDIMRCERKAYAELRNSEMARFLNIQMIDGTTAPDPLAEDILSRVPIKNVERT